MENLIDFFVAIVSFATRAGGLLLDPMSHLWGSWVVLLGVLATEQRRVRPAAFAKELGISLRKLRELFTIGAPITKIQGLVFINPETFYAWLDGFERKGRPGIKNLRGVSAPKGAETKSAAPAQSKKELAAAE